MVKKKSEVHFTKKREKRDNEWQGYYITMVQFPAETWAAEPGQHLFSLMIPATNLYCSVAQDFGKANICFVSEFKISFVD